MSSEEATYRIVFIGAPQVGKTTMMCGWYHLAKDIYDAAPQLEYADTNRLLQTYENYVGGSDVNPTTLGEVSRARFSCRHSYHEFQLELIDYSGEDVITSSSKLLHGKSSEAQGADEINFETGFLEDVSQADWIVIVQNPAALSSGAVDQVAKSLWLTKILPRLLHHGEVAEVSNATVYLSHGDTTDRKTVANATANIEAIFDRQNGSRLPIKCGNAKLWASDIKGDAEREFIDCFTHCMVQVLGKRGGSGLGEGTSKKLSSKLIILCGLILIAPCFAYWSLFSGDQISNSTELGEPVRLLELQGEIDKLEVDSRRVSYDKAQKLLGRVSEVKLKFASELQVSKELSDRLVAINELLKKTEKPKGQEEIKTAIISLKKLHGNNLSDFYKDLRKACDDSVNNSDKWDEAAIETWKELNSFAQLALNGFVVRLGTSYFKGPYWWTHSIGEDALKLEVWSTEVDDIKPFSKNSNDLPDLGTAKRDSIESGGKYAVRWTQAAAASSKRKDLQLSVTIENRIWVRVYSYDFSDEELVSIEVPRTGPLGMDWFGKPHAVQVHGKTSELQVKLEYSENVVVPKILEEVFVEN